MGFDSRCRHEFGVVAASRRAFGSKLSDPSRPRMSVAGSSRRSSSCRWRLCPCGSSSAQAAIIHVDSYLICYFLGVVVCWYFGTPGWAFGTGGWLICSVACLPLKPFAYAPGLRPRHSFALWGLFKVSNCREIWEGHLRTRYGRGLPHLLDLVQQGFFLIR